MHITFAALENLPVGHIYTTEIQNCLTSIKNAGGGTLTFTEGTYLCGTVEIFSNTTIIIEKGATLLGSPHLKDHVFENKAGGIFFARDAENICLQGSGIINGNAPSFFNEGEPHTTSKDFNPEVTWQGRRHLTFGSTSTEHGPLKSPGRPGNMLTFARCKNIAIKGITLTGATYWTMHFADCEQLLIEDMIINNDPRHPNNDGIHLTTCRHAQIRNCQITSGDDCIALSGIKEHNHEKELELGLSGLSNECADIEVSHCRLSSRSSAIRAGYGNNPVRRIYLHHNEIHHSHRGILIQASENNVEDITIEKTKIQTQLYHGIWWGCGEPICLTAVRFPKSETVHFIKKISISELEISAPCGIIIFAEKEDHIQDLQISNCKIEKSTDPLHHLKGGNVDLRPTANLDLAVFEFGEQPISTHLSKVECHHITSLGF